MRYTFCYVLSVLLVFGCSQKSGTDATNSPTEDESTALPGPDWTIRQVEDEEDLLLRLAPNMTGTPKNEVERGKNEAAEYVLDKKWDMQATRTGLLYQIVAPGEGDPIQWGDRLAAHYEGRFLDGQVFDSSYERGKPLEFYVGNMIPGWNEGLQKARVGSKLLLVIPGHLGYGSQGLGDGKGGTLVPPNATLVFRIEVLRKISENEKE